MAGKRSKASSTSTYSQMVGKQGAMKSTTTTRRPKSGTKRYTKVSKPYTPGVGRMGAEGPKKSAPSKTASPKRLVTLSENWWKKSAPRKTAAKKKRGR